MTAILLGLISALLWGGGDFVGGLASRRIGAYRAVMFGEAFGLALLFGAALALREPLAPLQTLLISAAAGVVGCLGLIVLYQAMSVGQMSVAAPLSALLAAALPVIVGTVTEGLPAAVQISGMGVALAAVWLISQNETGFKVAHLADLRLPLLAGLAFGAYFILTHHATQAAIVWPLIASRLAGTLMLLTFLWLRREPLRMSGSAAWLVVLNGLLDVGGNTFFVLAGRWGRMDLAAVLSSLYPGGTVLLAWLILKERLTRQQTLGIGAALAAIVLLTLE